MNHLRRAYVWGLLAIVFFSVVSLLVRNEGIAGFDTSVISVVQGWENPKLTEVMESFTWLGTTIVVIVIAVCILLFLAFVLGHRMELLLFLAVVGGAPLLNRLLKAAFHRERPDIHRLVEELGYSYPSGHSMAAFALYGVLTFLLWRHVRRRTGRIILVVLGSSIVTCIGISRIYLGAHYPSDVLGGYLASGVWLALMIEIFRSRKLVKQH
ncbi:phosphatase PAP2 family protein [Cohnella luojiensis]|uniref:Phosphatase PAP2 family protein n=1 Tax=Cohnella luojiensis TaxID=652876 RepID=A0A4Y8M577_9BACL|nr:phosphatase PAP2 family protein [Cohnella luojiensis]